MKFKEKVNSSKILYAFFILIVYFFIEFLLNGFYGTIIPNWNGLVNFLYDAADYTDSGYVLYSEVTVALLMIPLLLVFGNTYIFKKAEMTFKDRIKFVWPFIVELVFLGIICLISGGAFENFNSYEFFSMILLYFFVGIFEEFLCRGWLLNEFVERFGKNRNGIIYSLVVSSFIFGVMHVTNIFSAGQSVTGTIVQIIMAMFMGLGLGSTYLQTKNIWTVVLLHGFYDLVLSFSQLNISTSCYTSQTDFGVFTLIIGLFINLIFTAPLWLNTFKFLSKSNINNYIDDKVTLSKEDIDNDKSKYKTITIIQIIVVVVTVLLNIGDVFGNHLDTCALYDTIDLNSNNYEMTYSYISEYNLEHNKNLEKVVCNELDTRCIEEEKLENNDVDILVNDDIYFSYNEKGLNVKYNNTDYLYELEDIYTMSVTNTSYGFTLSLIKKTSDGSYVYFNNYLTNEILSNNEIQIEEFNKSFKVLKLPIIKEVGTFKSDNENYPLFVSVYERYYVIDKDGKINIMNIKTSN